MIDNIKSRNQGCFARRIDLGINKLVDDNAWINQNQMEGR